MGLGALEGPLCARVQGGRGASGADLQAEVQRLGGRAGADRDPELAGLFALGEGQREVLGPWSPLKALSRLSPSRGATDRAGAQVVLVEEDQVADDVALALRKAVDQGRLLSSA